MNETERLADVAALHHERKSAPQTCCQVWCSLVQKKALTIERKGLYLLVPRDRIELPTRGFSVLRHCVIFQELACGAHQIAWCKPLFHTLLNTPPHPTSPVSGHLPSSPTHFSATQWPLLPHLWRQLPTKLLGYIRLVAMILVPQHGRDRIYHLARPVRAVRHA